jgi:hypothetical protein
MLSKLKVLREEEAVLLTKTNLKTETNLISSKMKMMRKRRSKWMMLASTSKMQLGPLKIC